ncbi:MAG TPA: PEP-CTERM sorting domain-containing protein [Xanthobacteraceae bacterium]|nr:PEP-CTERM sorting domain-containing protein [Xanthobacteraceae bacterium]
MSSKVLLAATLAAAALFWGSPASAVMIAAGSELSLDGSDAFTATSVTFTNPANIGGETGSFITAGLTNCSGCATMTNFTSSMVDFQLYTATEGLISTALMTAGLPLFNFVVGPTLDSLTVTGAGTLTLTGFDPTPGQYILTTQGPGPTPIVDVTFSVTSVGTPVPEPGSLAILGAALAGLGLVGWRRRKAGGTAEA